MTTVSSLDLFTLRSELVWFKCGNVSTSFSKHVMITCQSDGSLFGNGIIVADLRQGGIVDCDKDRIKIFVKTPRVHFPQHAARVPSR